MSNALATNSNAEAAETLGAYLEKIESLNIENNILKEQLAKAKRQKHDPSDDVNLYSTGPDAKSELKIQELNLIIQQKDAEIADLKKKLLDSVKKGEILMSNNGRLVEELTKLQDYIKNLESMNMSNLTGSMTGGFPIR